MNADEVRGFLKQRGIRFAEQSIPSGMAFRCAAGEVINVYDTGRISVQGKATELKHEIEEWAGLRPVSVPSTDRREDGGRGPGPSDQVFIVYGHDLGARDSLELLLRRMGLSPIVLGNLTAGGDTIIEKLERYLGANAQLGFACVLLTPDDEGHAVGKAEDKKYRARQNVVLELGMVLARLGRRRVAILHKESVELPSDIAGLIYISFKERVDEAKVRLYRELEDAGYRPKRDALS